MLFYIMFQEKCHFFSKTDKSYARAIDSTLLLSQLKFRCNKNHVVAPIGPLIEATMNSKQGVKQD
jgi:hypothetical protein